MNRYFIQLVATTALNLSLQASETNNVTTVNRLPTPPYPSHAMYEKEQGCLIVTVKFGNDGGVADCQILRSSGTLDIDIPTVRFIKAHWRNLSLAGQTLTIPVNFQIPNGWPKEPDNLGDINPLKPGDPDRTVVMNVTFGKDGRVQDVSIAQSSGIPRLDGDTMAFVWNHWMSKPYAGRTMRVPIVYKPKPEKTATSQGQAGG